MSETTPRAAVDAAVKALLDDGAGPGNSLHSWRCEYPDIYGECDCVQETAREITAAVVEALGVREETRSEHVPHYGSFNDHRCGDPTEPCRVYRQRRYVSDWQEARP